MNIKGSVDKWHQSETVAWLRSAQTGYKYCVFQRDGEWFSCVSPRRKVAFEQGPFTTRNHAAIVTVIVWEWWHRYHAESLMVMQWAPEVDPSRITVETCDGEATTSSLLAMSTAQFDEHGRLEAARYERDSFHETAREAAEAIIPPANEGEA